MLLIKLIYLIVLIISAMFFILYRDMLAIILFCVLAAIPVLLLMSVIIMRLCIKFKIKCKSGVIVKGEKESFTVIVKNKSPLPIPKLILYGKCHNAFFLSENNSEIYFWAKPFSSHTFDMEIISEHVGNISVRFSKARVYDYFGVFSLPFNVHLDFDYSVIPEVQPVDFKLHQNLYSISESNVFSKHKPGDDPSEIFQIRDYIDGDKLNKIHWKLSSKQDSYIVKDYSLPISESVLLLVELCDKNKDYKLLDTVFETLFSISHMFIDRETVHSIGWYNPSAGSYYSTAIEDIDDLFTAMGMLYNNAQFYEEPYLAGLDSEHLQGFSHAFYIAPQITSIQCELINSNGNSSCIYYLIDVIGKDSHSQTDGLENCETITVIEGQTAECINSIN